jgi:hypothetical protein
MNIVKMKAEIWFCADGSIAIALLDLPVEAVHPLQGRAFIHYGSCLQPPMVFLSSPAPEVKPAWCVKLRG